jgi:hypothetical protein
MNQHIQSTPNDEYSDEAMDRLIAGIADDRQAAIVLAEAVRRFLAPVARTLDVGAVVDATTRFLDAARSEVK